ncbi:hypothetical protein [Pedobacter frigoris]|uniref:Lipoprotein n=1 Tax=Pedobacter frigoris TaxID=2571272 RepID=A0A4U1CHW8_9SPHI|nr:hypothetical protein [Pedobacter frigoris]TKC04227.1 hypothetical protein FA047_16650 [Pedobacter frigoris]
MKRIKIRLFSCVAALLFFASCENSTKSYIDGTYASYESGEYSISKDTLVIMPYGDKGDYQVIRKSSFQTVRNGKLQPKEQKIREYMGRFDPKTKMLIIDAQGKKISFFPDKNSLLLMQREYHKVVKQ